MFATGKISCNDITDEVRFGFVGVGHRKIWGSARVARRTIVPNPSLEKKFPESIAQFKNPFFFCMQSQKSLAMSLHRMILLSRKP
jgi:hypothetical protein